MQQEHTLHPDLATKAKTERITIGGKSAAELISEIESAHMLIDGGALEIMNSGEFTVQNQEEITLVKISLADLGFTGPVTTQAIFDRAKELGLTLCPPEVGPWYRLKYTNQPPNETLRIAMNPISALGKPCVFNLDCYVNPKDSKQGAGVTKSLKSIPAPLDDKWSPLGEQWFFCLR